jgi:YHS domain-containing protein
MTFTYENEKGNTYYLHGRETTLKNGTKRTIYFFAKEEKDGTLDSVPEGYMVMETSNGLPVLKKDK